MILNKQAHKIKKGIKNKAIDEAFHKSLVNDAVYNRLQTCFSTSTFEKKKSKNFIQHLL